jgi:hypothetical protein
MHVFSEDREFIVLELSGQDDVCYRVKIDRSKEKIVEITHVPRA